MKWLWRTVVLLFTIIAEGQPGYNWRDGRLSIFHWKNIERIDYSLQCPLDWKIDSTSTELKMSPKLTLGDSLTVFIYSFKTKVVPFNLFIKDPPVDYDAKTTITLNKNQNIYTVTSTQRCASCHVFTNQIKEQRYSVANKMVYIIYCVATDDALEKYKNNIATISSTFIPKK